MADDPARDVFPTKESGISSTLQDPHKYEKRYVIHLSRSDLEDQFYKFKEENNLLKKAARKQEENLKKLATKMTRLLQEKKSLESTNSPGFKRDLELEEMVEELQDKVHQLEKTNSHLREKMLVAKQQVVMQVKRPYSHIPPKVNTGNFSRSGFSPYASSLNLKNKSNLNISRKAGVASIPPYALSLLEEARHELSNLKMLISSQKDEIEQYEHENENLKQRLRMREIEFQDELNMMKSQLTQRQRQHVQENLDLIRLHRELKQKSANYLSLQSQYSDMEERMKILKLNHDHLLKEMDDLKAHFKAEQKKNRELLGELQKAQLSFAASAELQERITLLQKENDFLRETNDKFVKSALAIEKERAISVDDGKHLKIESMLREKISNLELAIENQNKEKISYEEKLAKEKEAYVAIEEACETLRQNCNQLQSKVEDFEAKLSILKSHHIEFEDLEEAVSLLNLKKENKLKILEMSPEDCTEKPIPEVLLKEPIPQNNSEELEEMKVQLLKAESDYAGALNELSNVREMLTNQYTINKTAESEIASLNEKLVKQEKEFEGKMEEYLHLLDLRSTKIQQLEKQLNDIAYGTHTVQASFPDMEDECGQTLELNKGENILEIHIIKINLSSDGLNQFSGTNRNLFLTWNFYEFELQTTPIASSKNPIFNFSTQYTVQVDDYFLCYLQNKRITLELHESLGINYRTLASCQVDMSDVLMRSQSKIFGSGKLKGVSSKDIDFGTVDFWVQLKIPMEESLKFFKEKLKALKYIHSNKERWTAAVNLLKQPIHKEAFMNELHIKIIRGMNLKSRQKDVQPSTFCVYKFYDLPDQDTHVIPASNNPEYSDHRMFPIFISMDAKKYLENNDLYIYVFDDNESDIASYIGRAAVPLKPLLQNKPIKGIFNLEKNEEHNVGALEILIYWQFEYNMDESDALSNVSEPVRILSSPSHCSTSSASDSDQITEGSMNDTSIMQPAPVPKPRKFIPLVSTPVQKDPYNSSSSDEESVQSPGVSPIFTDHNHLAIEENVKQSQASAGPGNNINVPEEVTEEIHSTMGSTVQKSHHLPIVKESSLETSDEDKHDFSDESEDKSRREVLNEQRESCITIGVHYLVLRADAAVLQDNHVKMLYVEYRFLDYPLEELETPFSLPKVSSPNVIRYNFEKAFPLTSGDAKKWNLLSEMLFSKTPELSLIRFTIVSEPPSDENELDCEEIGYGTVDLKEILLNECDKIQEDIIIYDAENSDIEIGRLNVSVQALDAIRKLKKC